MILPLFALFIGLALVLIIIGLAKPTESAQALIGFSFLFILSLSLINGTLEYKDGDNATYVYGNNFTGYHWDYDNNNPSSNTDEFLFHRAKTDTYSSFEHKAIGYWLAVVSTIGFAGVLYGLKGGFKRKE